ncbi:MAG: tRNA dihydrouridine(20/20a) synthase DusA [Proteobacteria bacterium]|nr:tRNA dihydrouridine(20/20a) synthase DusA [Pseudomonadota bacterium]
MTVRPDSINRWALSVAPMMDWTDRHCRYFLRQVSKRVRLYTEMITAPALMHGDVARHLDFDPAEHPVALQLGGSDPAELARAAHLGEQWGYDEVNLNCGCPSERVQTGSFGACLMADPALVAACVKAMRDAVAVPVTVKHRIGLDHDERYAFVRDFVGTVAEAGCGVFIVHARNAVLRGLSPKENREIPPLRYEVVARLKRDFPELTIVINGGFTRWDAIEKELGVVDGVMLGRVAYHDPYFLAEADRRIFGDAAPVPTRAAIARSLADYARREARRGTPLRAITRHALGLYHATPGGRHFRRILSDAAKLAGGDATLIDEALRAVEHTAGEADDARERTDSVA